MSKSGKRLAVIDVGSNSVLLVVSEFSGSRWQPIFESSEVTGLGEGTLATGVLSPSGIERTLQGVKRSWDAAQNLGAEVFAFATMAARIANNADEFLEIANRQETPISILSADEEARLGLRSVAADPIFSMNSSLAVVDIGGHSTEIAICHKVSGVFEENLRKSFPIGTLGLRSTILTMECPNPGDLLAASNEIDNVFLQAKDPLVPACLVAIGATATNLIALRLQLREWKPELVHSASLAYEELSQSVGTLSRLTEQDRASLPGLEKGRESTIHVGALILERAMHFLKQETCRVSTKGWRHAMLEEIGERYL